MTLDQTKFGFSLCCSLSKTPHWKMRYGRAAEAVSSKLILSLTAPQITLLSSPIHFPSTQQLFHSHKLRFPSWERGGNGEASQCGGKPFESGDMFLINREQGVIQGQTAVVWTVWGLPGVFLCVMHAHAGPPWLWQWHKEASVRRPQIQSLLTSLTSVRRETYKISFKVYFKSVPSGLFFGKI